MKDKLIGERSAEEILHDHFKRVCTPINNRAPLETQLTLVLQAALQAMEEYASQLLNQTEREYQTKIDDLRRMIHEQFKSKDNIPEPDSLKSRLKAANEYLERNGMPTF